MTAIMVANRGNISIIMADTCISWPIDHPERQRTYVYQDELQKIYLLTQDIAVAYCGSLLLLKDIHRELHKVDILEIIRERQREFAERPWVFSDFMNRLFMRIAGKSAHKRKHAEIAYTIVNANGLPCSYIWKNTNYKKKKVIQFSNLGVSLVGGILNDSDLCCDLCRVIDARMSEMANFLKRCDFADLGNVTSLVVGDVINYLERVDTHRLGVGKLFQVVAFNGECYIPYELENADRYIFSQGVAGVSYRVSLLWDDQGGWVQVNHESGQKVKLLRLDECFLSRTPDRSNIFRLRAG